MADETNPTQADVDKAIKDALAKQRDDFDTEVLGLKNKNKELVVKLREASGVKPEDLAAIEAERDELQNKLRAAEKAAKDATTAAEKAAKALEAETGFTQKLLISDGLKSALLANGVKDEDFIDSLTAKFAGGAKVVVDGDARNAMIGDKPLADAIKEWAGSDAGKKFVSAPANSGGNASGGSRAKADAKTITRTAFNALDQQAQGEAGLQMAKGELKIAEA